MGEFLTTLFHTLTPGFSPVRMARNEETVSTVFRPHDKPLKRLGITAMMITGLKPGVNESLVSTV
jgi:hypothetical protein